MDIKFDFDDILITPGMTTNIQHRGDIDIFDENGFLPLFTAPMDTVVDLTNYKLFLKNGIRVVLPRTIDEHKLPYNENSEYLWFSYSINDMEELFLTETTVDKVNSRAVFIQNYLKNNKLHALIDIANGHMSKLHSLIALLKEKYGDNLLLMVGNIANPDTYKVLSELGVWGIRCTIGNGSGCHVAGTKIKTKDGISNIEDIIPNDIVLTHNGEYKKVTHTHALLSDNIYKINDNVATGDHEYYVLNKKYKDIVCDENIHEFAEWISVEKLDTDYYLLEIDENV